MIKKNKFKKIVGFCATDTTYCVDCVPEDDMIALVPIFRSENSKDKCRFCGVELGKSEGYIREDEYRAMEKE